METNIFISPRAKEVTCLLNPLCYLVKLLLCCAQAAIYLQLCCSAMRTHSERQRVFKLQSFIFGGAEGFSVRVMCRVLISLKYFGSDFSKGQMAIHPALGFLCSISSQ